MDSLRPQILTFEDIKIGDKAEVSHVLTDADVRTFAALTGDYNPLHVDENFARKTLFRRPVVHGMLSASFISTLIGMVLPGGGALWTSQKLEFLQPARVGDEIKVSAIVKQKSQATRLLVLGIEITNQDGKLLVTGESTVKVLEIIETEKAGKGNRMNTIIVTGGNGGIGSAVALKLAEEGYAVVVNYLYNPDEADRIIKEIRNQGGSALAIKADISSEVEVVEMIELAKKQLGPIGGIVHCAAPRNEPRKFDELDWASFQEQLDIQLKGAFYCVKNALPDMLEVESGSIVFIGSIYGEGVPPTQQARYVVAKAALAALARSLAIEYGPHGIRINVVAPGMTQTDMIADLPEKTKMLTKMQTPLRRLAEPMDIANVVTFLFSPAARHITGQTIRVCGGVVMG